ncbi:hypothetical protein AMTR_s00031p00196530 [Amborella trichopoda]|uniref:Uncharacterized protein n=1 Tax=Amborella trichopoda TaxID=13333 RepID=U5CTJ5_AMBTC|nr:hypothetical protein AMTR_s00031p00196530 [Amborella trichopoda]
MLPVEAVHVVEATTDDDALYEGMLIPFEIDDIPVPSLARSLPGSVRFECQGIGAVGCLETTVELANDGCSEDIDVVEVLASLASDIESRSEPNSFIDVYLALVLPEPVAATVTTPLVEVTSSLGPLVLDPSSDVYLT